jgi:uncharacterized membrane protein
MANNSSQDVDANKAMAILAYFIFFLPLLAAKGSQFAMYHANQGFMLFLFAVAVNILGTMIPVLGWFLILPIGNLLILVFFVMGLLNAANGQMKPLPLIGNYTLLK